MAPRKGREGELRGSQATQPRDQPYLRNRSPGSAPSLKRILAQSTRPPPERGPLAVFVKCALCRPCCTERQAGLLLEQFHEPGTGLVEGLDLVLVAGGDTAPGHRRGGLRLLLLGSELLVHRHLLQLLEVGVRRLD